MSIKAIHTLKSKLGISEAEYRELLLRAGGVSSSRDLSEKGDRAVMAELRKRERKNASDIVSKIWFCWYQLFPLLEPEKRDALYLVGFLKKAGVIVRHSGRKLYLEDLTPREAVKAVESLKKKIKQAQSELGVPF